MWHRIHLLKAVEYINDHKDDFAATYRDIYEFGVYRGESLQLIQNLFYAYQINFHQANGFDSFDGLPAESPNLKTCSYFHKGSFKTASCDYQLKQGQIIKSWFSELNKDHIIKYNLMPAMLVHIDSDLYISAKQALSFLLDINLYARQFLLAYDEFKSTTNLLDGGESLAHKEICDQYKLECELIYKNENGNEWQTTFVVKSIGQKTEYGINY